MNDLQRRIERLERTQRRMTCVLALAASGLVALAAAGFTRHNEPAPVMKASELIVVDGDGRKVAWLGADKRAGRLRLYNESGDEFWATPDAPPVAAPGAAEADMEVEIPPPLTAAQIQAMTLKEANVALMRVATARRHGHHDEATAERLKREFDLLLRRVAELRSGGA